MDGVDHIDMMLLENTNICNLLQKFQICMQHNVIKSPPLTGHKLSISTNRGNMVAKIYCKTDNAIHISLFSSFQTTKANELDITPQINELAINSHDEIPVTETAAIKSSSIGIDQI